MKPAPFEYLRARTTHEALTELVLKPSSKPIAGGQSLGAMMNLRVARPGFLIDVGRIPELRTHERKPDRLLIGACVTHAEIEDDVIDDVTSGFLPYVAGRIAYRPVRNRGTIGGSIAHADPAADWVTALTAVGASVVLESPVAVRETTNWWSRLRSSAGGAPNRRTVDMTSFICAPYSTALEPGELVIGVEIPAASADMRWGYEKFCRKVGELAEAIGAVVIDPQRRFARVVVGAVGGKPVILDAATHTLASTTKAPAFEELVGEIDRKLARLEPVKRQHAAVCVERAIAEALRA